MGIETTDHRSSAQDLGYQKAARNAVSNTISPGPQLSPILETLDQLFANYLLG